MDITSENGRYSAGPALIYADREGFIRCWNEDAEKLFGFSATEALGASLDLIVPEKLRPAHWQGYARALTSGESRYAGRSMFTRALHKSGERLYIEMGLDVVIGPQGEVCGSIATARAAPPRVTV